MGGIWSSRSLSDNQQAHSKMKSILDEAMPDHDNDPANYILIGNDDLGDASFYLI
jgi:hypothetical protein